MIQTSWVHFEASAQLRSLKRKIVIQRNVIGTKVVAFEITEQSFISDRLFGQIRDLFLIKDFFHRSRFCRIFSLATKLEGVN